MVVGMRLASTLAVLCFSILSAGCKAQRPPVGISVTLLRRGPDPFPHMTDLDGLYIMTVLPGRKVRVRGEQITFDDLGKRIEEVFRTRAERLILVRVEGQVEYRDVIEALDRTSSRVRLHYGLMTKSSEPTPAEPSLFMGGKFIYRQYLFPDEATPAPK